MKRRGELGDLVEASPSKVSSANDKGGDQEKKGEEKEVENDAEVEKGDDAGDSNEA